MPLIVDDKSKDTEIDRATEVIEIKKNYLMNNWAWMTRAQRLEKKYWISECEKNREKLIEKKLGKTIKRMPSLRATEPQTALEKQLLLDLIESV